jgi:hypothetical protein
MVTILPLPVARSTASTFKYSVAKVPGGFLQIQTFSCLMALHIDCFQDKVYADKRLRSDVEINGVDRTSLGTFAALDAKSPIDHHAPAFALRECPCWTGQGAGGRIAGQTGLCLKAGGQAAG